MGKPFALSQLHMGEFRTEAGIFRGAGIDAKGDPAAALMHMADAHLLKMLTVFGTLDAVVRFSAAEAVPHTFDGCGNIGGGPIGEA